MKKIFAELGQAFSSWYTATEDGKTLYPVVQCPDAATRTARIALLRLVERALENGVSALGIATVQEM